ncbi:protein of unknown function [Streptomyces murinus]
MRRTAPTDRRTRPVHAGPRGALRILTRAPQEPRTLYRRPRAAEMMSAPHMNQVIRTP